MRAGQQRTKWAWSKAEETLRVTGPKSGAFRALSDSVAAALGDSTISEAREELLQLVWEDTHGGVTKGHKWKDILQLQKPDGVAGDTAVPCACVEFKTMHVGLPTEENSREYKCVCRGGRRVVTCFS
jgi:hypothetical protein